METVNQLLAHLNSRLPELEWNLSKIAPIFISQQMLPKGLFQSGFGKSGKDCVEEIKSDIKALAKQTNETSALFLAQRIQQKINVLVKTCQIQRVKMKPQEKTDFTLNKLSTRQQWIQEVEKEIAQLISQQQAMYLALDKKNNSTQSSDLLELQAELGEVERRLTLAREALDKALLL